MKDHMHLLVIHKRSPRQKLTSDHQHERTQLDVEADKTESPRSVFCSQLAATCINTVKEIHVNIL